MLVIEEREPGTSTPLAYEVAKVGPFHLYHQQDSKLLIRMYHDTHEAYAAAVKSISTTYNMKKSIVKELCDFLMALPEDGLTQYNFIVDEGDYSPHV